MEVIQYSTLQHKEMVNNHLEEQSGLLAFLDYCATLILCRGPRSIRSKKEEEPHQTLATEEEFKVWSSVDQSRPVLDPDAEFWWNETGRALAAMMHAAEYDRSSQHRGLLFHLRYVVPYLGSKPTKDGYPQHWRSFMTDDFSPLEYSWNWGVGSTAPAIRYSIEAIGKSAGTPQDPVNRQAVHSLLQNLKSVQPNVNLELYEIFMKEFVGDQHTNITIPSATISHPSSAFVAFELGRTDVNVKAYVIPNVAEQTGVSRLKVFMDTMQTLERSTGLSFPSYPMLQQFLNENQEKHNFDFIGIAIDLVEPKDSRLKVYVRSSRTSFASMVEVMTLNGRLSILDSGGYEELRALWQRVFGLEKMFDMDHELARSSHETAGMLYNIDIHPGQTMPETKVYLPVKHYGIDDSAIAKGLEDYLSGKNRSVYCKNYRNALQNIAAHRTLEDAKGLQTYISCMIKKGELALTSYISPEIYSHCRLSKRTPNPQLTKPVLQSRC